MREKVGENREKAKRDKILFG